MADQSKCKKAKNKYTRNEVRQGQRKAQRIAKHVRRYGDDQAARKAFDAIPLVSRKGVEFEICVTLSEVLAKKGMTMPAWHKAQRAERAGRVVV